MQYDPHDTIAAIATASGAGARGIIRVAGPHAVAAAARICSLAPRSLAELRIASVVTGRLHLASEPPVVLDCDLFVWPNQHSYTRGPLVEIHLVGSPPLLHAALAEVCRHGARLAGPGEFTLRAFLAGRIDLTQAEAVLGVIDARGDADLQVALRQLAGGLSGPLHALRDSLLNLLAHLEAGLDFVEEDIEFITPRELIGRLADAEAQVAQLTGQLSARDDAIDTVRIVLVGEPNVGKSSLYNSLVGRGRRPDGPPVVEALVSPVSGTTRDYLAARFEVGGHVCELVDTAGLEQAADAGVRQPADPISLAAQRGAEYSRQAARLELLCFDSSRALSPRERARLAAAGPNAVVVFTKSDLPAAIPPAPSAVLTSSAHAAGIDELWQRIAVALSELDETPTSSVGTTAVRCRESLRLAGDSLRTACRLAARGGQEELVASEVRVALNELGRVVGAVYTDDILDRIFSRFCIGK